MRIVSGVGCRVSGVAFWLFWLLLTPSLWFPEPAFAQTVKISGPLSISGTVKMVVLSSTDTLYSTDFEAEDTDLVPTWDAHGGAGDAPTLNTNPTYAHGGNNSGRFHYGTSSANVWVSKLLPERSHFFMRGYVYFKSPEGGQVGIVSQRKLFWVGDETTAGGSGGSWDIILSSWESNAGPPSTLGFSWLSQGSACHGSSPQDWMPGTPDLNWDTWYSMEVEAQLNTPVVDPGPFDGIFRVWLNGTMIWERTDAKINGNCTTPFTFFSVGRQGEGEGVVDEYRYWDDVKISAAYIGP